MRISCVAFRHDAFTSMHGRIVTDRNATHGIASVSGGPYGLNPSLRRRPPPDNRTTLTLDVLGNPYHTPAIYSATSHFNIIHTDSTRLTHYTWRGMMNSSDAHWTSSYSNVIRSCDRPRPYGMCSRRRGRVGRPPAAGTRDDTLVQYNTTQYRAIQCRTVPG